MKKVVVDREARLLDDCFKIEEAILSYEQFDGTMSSPVRRLCFERGDSVAAIVFNRDKQKVILVEQFRYPAFRKGDGWIVEIPAGSVPAHETPEAALRREVREEIGYEIDRLHPIATFYPSPGGSSERVILFFGEVTDAGKVAAGGGLAEAGENIRTIELSLQALQDDLMHARFHDAKTLIAVMWLLNERSRFASPGIGRADE